MAQSPFTKVFRKGFSLGHTERPGAPERPSPVASRPEALPQPEAVAPLVRVLYLAGEARETRFVSGAFDKTWPHLGFEIAVPLADAQAHLESVTEYEAVVLGWSVPEADAVDLIGWVRERSPRTAVIAIGDRVAERHRAAGVDDVVARDASLLTKLPAAIDAAVAARTAADGAVVSAIDTPVDPSPRVDDAPPVDVPAQHAPPWPVSAQPVEPPPVTYKLETSGPVAASVEAASVEAASANAASANAASARAASVETTAAAANPSHALEAAQPLRTALAGDSAQACTHSGESRLRSMVDSLPAPTTGMSAEGTIHSATTPAPVPATPPIALAPSVLRDMEGALRRLSCEARDMFDRLEAAIRDAEAEHDAVAARHRDEQVALDAARHTRRQSYDAFFRDAAHSMLHASLEGEIVDMNAAFARALGYESPHALMAGGTSTDRFTPLDDWRRATEAWRGGQAEGPVEMHWKRRDGGLLTLSLHGHVVAGLQGSSDQIEVIAENLTAQRTLDRQLRRARRWEEVARVTSGMAADLQATIEAVSRSTARLLADGSTGEPTEAQLIAIHEHAAHALALSQQLVAFGRREERDEAALDVNAAVQAIETLLRRVADDHIAMTVALAPRLGPVLADRATVDEALLALTVAACDALPAGGRLDIATGNVEVGRHEPGPTEVAPGSYVLLSLTARGWGLAATPNHVGPHPLGSVTRAVERLGGSLTVTRATNESLTFGVYLAHAPVAMLTQG
jgi:PAS domain S-box-containing protein